MTSDNESLFRVFVRSLLLYTPRELEAFGGASEIAADRKRLKTNPRKIRVYKKKSEGISHRSFYSTPFKCSRAAFISTTLMLQLRPILCSADSGGGISMMYRASPSSRVRAAVNNVLLKRRIKSESATFIRAAEDDDDTRDAYRLIMVLTNRQYTAIGLLSFMLSQAYSSC